MARAKLSFTRTTTWSKVTGRPELTRTRTSSPSRTPRREASAGVMWMWALAAMALPGAASRCV